MRGVTYDRLVQTLGERDTELLIGALGGQRVYFPVAGPSEALARALGAEAARRICARLAGAGNDVYERLALYLNDQITLAVLGQTLTTQMPKEGGSRAAASVHQAVRRDILQADAKRLAASLSRDLVKPIIDLNFGPQQKYPSVSLGLPDDQDVKVFADAVSELADRGLRVSQRVVLDKLGLPEAADDEPVLTPKQSIAETGPDDNDSAAAQSSKKKARWSRY